MLELEFQKLKLGEYCMSSEFSDVKIKIKKETLPAHKVILSARNAIFRGMFASNMLESTENVLEITDCDVSTFKTYLKYLYTGEVDDEDEICNLLYLAEKYIDQKLKSICECKLLKDVNLENVMTKLSLALQYRCHILKHKAADFIVKNYDEVEKSPEFMSITSSEKLELFLPVAKVFNRKVQSRYTLEVFLQLNFEMILI